MTRTVLALALSFNLGAAARSQGPASLPGMDSSAAALAQTSSAQTPSAQAPTAQVPAAAPSASSAAVTTAQGLPTEVTITGTSGSSAKVGGQKPPLSITVDPFATIRGDLKPDPSLLLAVSPLTVSWQKTHPDFLDNQRVVEPWRTSFGRGPGIVFDVRKELDRAVGRHLSDQEAAHYGWTLTVADEAGRVFYRSGGPDSPPAQIVWSGENEDGEWIRAGHSYSAVYSFTAPDGSPYTIAGDPLLFHGIVHQEATGLYISLDSEALFGLDKSAQKLETPGLNLLRSAADLLKRGYSGIPLSVRVYAATGDLGQVQAVAVAAYLQRELMAPPETIGQEASAASFADQRVEIVVLNR
ncbi:MAG TPA: hypothetical protein VNK24_03735 [Elusimicrobiota bacterium]|nr:hypothetical protein [Elusimicrobiota bacterium]